MQQIFTEIAEQVTPLPHKAKRRSVSFKSDASRRLETVLGRKGRFPMRRIATKPSIPTIASVCDTTHSLPLGDAWRLYGLFLNPYGSLKQSGIAIETEEWSLRLLWHGAKLPELRLPKDKPDAPSGQTAMQILPAVTEHIAVHGEKLDALLPPDGVLQWETPAVVTDSETHFLRALLADPTAILAENGRIMGICVFCGRKLRGNHSTRLGYGKTCAAKFGMVWGTNAVPDDAARDAAVHTHKLSQSSVTGCVESL